jgi:hypothetical protein
MRKRIFLIVAAALTLTALLLAGGCNGKVNMVSGSWKLLTTGDETMSNQQEYGMPFSIIYDVYPDGRVCMLIGGSESYVGKYTMDRDTFKFAGEDGEENYSGSFVVDMNATDQNTGESIVTLTIVLDDKPVSVVLQKVMDYSGMIKYLKSQTTAPAASK